MIRLIPLAAILILALACGSNNSIQDEDSELKTIVISKSLDGDPVDGKDFPSIKDPLPQLGKKLFFSKILSGNRDVACASCHHPALGGGDALSLPIGVDAFDPNHLGPGRLHASSGTHHDGGPTVPRNAPTTFNIGLWEKFQFHDGRIEQLTETSVRSPDSAFNEADVNSGSSIVSAQARFPVTSPEEMKGFVFENSSNNEETRSALVERLKTTGDWLSHFQTGFQSLANASELITFENVTKAIEAYEKSQVFCETPWKKYVEGQSDAISSEAKEGAKLFFKDVNLGGAGCINCHSGDFFTDEDFHVLAVPFVGRGKGDDNGYNLKDDFGRC